MARPKVYEDNAARQRAFRARKAAARREEEERVKRERLALMDSIRADFDTAWASLMNVLSSLPDGIPCRALVDVLTKDGIIYYNAERLYTRERLEQ